MGNLTGWGAEVVLLWEPAEVSAADLATSGRRLTAQRSADTDSEGRRGPRREPEAMDEQSVEVRGIAESGGWVLFSIRGSMLSLSLWEAASAEREAGSAVMLPTLRVPGAEAVPQSGAAGFQRCLGTCSGRCSQAEPFQEQNCKFIGRTCPAFSPRLALHDLTFFSLSGSFCRTHTPLSHSTDLKTSFQH